MRVVGALAVLASLVAAMLFWAYCSVRRENRLRLAAEAEIRQLAFKDALTGLDNRHHFFILAQQALKMAQRKRAKLAVLYLDLNEFKPINDRFGHQAGDEILKHVGSVLQKITRQSDIVARFGGDEFVLVLDNIGNDGGLARLLAQLDEALERGIDYQKSRLRVSASVGVAIYPNDGLDIDTLLERADSHMYRIKFDGKMANEQLFVRGSLVQDGQSD
ncbi:MAG: hypothetical protein CVV13_13405 [Gammaproteobacteria bacterium HGW-Gammaproteobacteria-3]|nr:MAG: hypothetical protein CVV13_13405 [Gammaproteobacteria bacterium HGW-Gammaproteobacteria-3]